MEPRKPAVKFVEGTQDVLSVLAVPFGGPFEGKDLDGEYFSDRTDLCLDWFPSERPLLYGHGKDDATGVAAIGRVDSKSARKDVDGWWVQAQLNKAHAYYDSIKKLVEEEALHASSGAMGHLVKKAADGEILRWPFVELSLTPTPANPFAVVKAHEAAKHYKAAGLLLTAPLAEEDTASYHGRLDWLLEELTEVTALSRKHAEQRIKEGRAISAARRERLDALMRTARDVASEIEALLAETEPKPRAATDDAPTEKGAAAAALTEFLRFQHFLAQEHARG